MNDLSLISIMVLIFSSQTSYCLIFVQCVMMAAGWQVVGGGVVLFHIYHFILLYINSHYTEK